MAGSALEFLKSITPSQTQGHSANTIRKLHWCALFSMNELRFKNHKKEKNPPFDYITNFKAPYIQTMDTGLDRPLLVNPLVSWSIHPSIRLSIHLYLCVSWLFLARMRSYTGCVSIVNKDIKWFRETRFQRKHIFMNFNCPQWAKWLRLLVNGAKWS